MLKRFEKHCRGRFMKSCCQRHLEEKLGGLDGFNVSFLGVGRKSPITAAKLHDSKEQVVA